MQRPHNANTSYAIFVAGSGHLTNGWVLRFAVKIESQVHGMAGKSTITASDQERAPLMALAGSRERGEADRARAVLLTLAGLDQPTDRRGVRRRGRYGPPVAQRFCQRRCCRVEGERRTRSACGEERSGFAGGHAVARGTCRRPTQLDDPPPSRRERSARGARISRSQLSKALRKKFRWRRPRHTLKGRQTASEVERVGLRLQLRKQQAEAGDIVLLYGDESEALTHPYLDRAWAKSGAELRIPAPGRHCQSKFYTACSGTRAGWSSTVFAHESATRSAGFDAENRLYLFALTVPNRASAGCARRPSLCAPDLPLRAEIACISAGTRGLRCK